ncbi:MAG: gephyrin-like molybdotransferase Glp [Candidatus Krumholzibacteria bacterium]
MITPPRARRLIDSHCAPLGRTAVSLSSALGYVLAQDVRTAMPLPRFDNSAMDGFALRSSASRRATPDRPVCLSIVQSIFAGDNRAHTIGKGEACRIMTGAPLPRGVDAVIPKERAHVEGSTLVVRQAVEKHRHVRRRGDEIGRNEVVLRRGQYIHPGVIACLASVGKKTVRVVRKPVVSVISTGDEAVEPGTKLGAGQIYDSNSYMVSAMLEQMAMPQARCRRIKDHYTALANAVGAALDKSDVLIVLGGVSVGDRDYLRRVLKKLRVREVFWRVRQKPGKPIYFGVKGRRLVFGLPGNPASAFTCFYLYVYPALQLLAGKRKDHLAGSVLPIEDPVEPDAERWLMLKGKTRKRPRAGVDKLPRQGSHMVTSLAETDRILVIPPDGARIERGRGVETLRLPHAEEIP